MNEAEKPRAAHASPRAVDRRGIVAGGLLIATVVTVAATFAIDDGAPQAGREQHEVPHGPWASFLTQGAPAYGGREGIIYRSPDGTRVAGSFTHSGRYSFTYPFDEFVVVTSGSVEVSVRSGNRFQLKAGDVAYFRKGMTVDFVAGENYGSVAMFVDKRPIRW